MPTVGFRGRLAGMSNAIPIPILQLIEFIMFSIKHPNLIRIFRVLELTDGIEEIDKTYSSIWN